MKEDPLVSWIYFPILLNPFFKIPGWTSLILCVPVLSRDKKCNFLLWCQKANLIIERPETKQSFNLIDEAKSAVIFKIICCDAPENVIYTGFQVGW